MTFANNTPPANSNQRPTPIDRRFDDPEAMIEAVVRRVIGNSAATPAPAAGADPIRDMVANTLRVGGIATEGKSDEQMLADYLDLVRKGAEAATATAINSRTHGEFSGYDLNNPAVGPNAR